MAPLLQLLSLFVLLSLCHRVCHGESRGGPRDSVCKSDNRGFMLNKGHGERRKLDEKQYKVTVSLIREKDNKTVDCVEDSTRYIVRISAKKFFKGFIITSTAPGTGYPANFVGKFRKAVHSYSQENLVQACDNTISHSDILKSNPVDLKWRSTASREVEFLYAVVFSRYVWLANQTARFPVCKKTPECITRVEPEASSGSGAVNITTDIPAGSALPASTCRLAERLLTLRLNITVGSHKPLQYTCVTKDRVQQCIGKCTYCDQGCQVVESRTVKRTYMCETNDPDPYVVQKIIPFRNEVQEHLKCECRGKYDSEQ